MAKNRIDLKVYNIKKLNIHDLKAVHNRWVIRYNSLIYAYKKEYKLRDGQESDRMKRLKKLAWEMHMRLVWCQDKVKEVTKRKLIGMK